MSPTLHPGMRRQTQLGILLLLISPLALAAPRLWGRFTESISVRDEPAVKNRTIDSTRPILGYAIVAHHIGDLGLYLESVDKIAALGANALTIVTPLFQKYVDSNDIRYRAQKCPSEEQLVAIFERARSHGMMTTIQPIVLIEKPDKKDWRGVIAPTDWEAWWASYDALIDKFLRVANAADVDMFVVGSELNSTESHLDQWKAVITKVRANFDGQITYSSNWDRYFKTELWPLVDVISVSSYFELQRNNPGAPYEELIEAWAPIRRDLIRFAEKQDMPLLLSEVGYPSLPWANAFPWNYVAKGTKADHPQQARCYEAFFEVWSDTVADPDSAIAGLTCYHWDPYHKGQKTDTGYGVEGKPAKKVIERGFAQIKRLVNEPRSSTRPTTRPSTRPAD